MGGALTFAALSSIQGWKAGGVFYGIPDLNIFRLDKITAKVVAHFGALDPLKGFSDIESAKKLKADCLREKYPVDVQYLFYLFSASMKAQITHFATKTQFTSTANRETLPST